MKTVLLIEDDAQCAKAIRFFLESLGFAVVWLDAVLSTDDLREVGVRPCAAVVDHRLPVGMSGGECIVALRDIYPELPCIALTGDTSPDTLGELSGLSAVLMVKPADPQVMTDRLGEALMTCIMKDPMGTECRCRVA